MQKTDMEKTLGYCLHNLAFNLKAVLKKTFKTNGYQLTPEAYFLLNLIPTSGIAQQTLVKKTGKDKAAITRLLDSLNHDGLIVRRVQPDNKRRSHIKLSEQGETVIEKINAELTRISEPMLVGISAAEREKLYHLLNQLNANLAQISDSI
ncbi:MarR family winged helix-turn-helix transcriptional regulator [Gayadomonas joobiniege]|uniref:MarR family winged helix-turn-helix transcriptional regulator n=1 Tax=Gayadomonas joobiniege TaxID=1234606 RepID=UPI0003793110|nr:MarR family transcriptional regulator [Gayadomonas joobiniege]